MVCHLLANYERPERTFVCVISRKLKISFVSLQLKRPFYGLGAHGVLRIVAPYFKHLPRRVLIPSTLQPQIPQSPPRSYVAIAHPPATTPPALRTVFRRGFVPFGAAECGIENGWGQLGVKVAGGRDIAWRVMAGLDRLCRDIWIASRAN